MRIRDILYILYTKVRFWTVRQSTIVNLGTNSKVECYRYGNFVQYYITLKNNVIGTLGNFQTKEFANVIPEGFRPRYWQRYGITQMDRAENLGVFISIKEDGTIMVETGCGKITSASNAGIICNAIAVL